MNNPDQNTEKNLKALPQRAIKKIRALCKGNGTKDGDVQIKSAGGEIIECEAITHLELHTEVAEEQKKGRQQVGELLEGTGQIDEAIKQLTESAAKNGDTRQYLANILLERPDKGFSLHAEYFDVDNLNREFCSHEACGTCQGAGNTACNKCGGQRKEVCNVCHGRSMIPCNYCNGAGYMQGPDGQQKQCNRCFGQRQTACTICQKTGAIACRQCKGSGTNTCGTCKGAAFYTRVVKIFVRLKTLFELDRAALPHPVVKIFEDAGDKMAEKGHIKLTAKQVKREDGGLAIQYLAVFPYGDLEFAINGTPYKTHLFGYKGKMLKLPNFLDVLIEKDYNLLKSASKDKNNAAGKIKKARKSRLISEALKAAISMPAKKAMLTLKRKFPLGLSNDLLKDIILTSNKALANATATARYGGLGASVLLMAALYTAYLMAGLRELALEALGSAPTMALDITLIALGGFIGNWLVAYMAKRPLRKALGKLMPDKKRGRFKAKRMIPAWVIYLLSILVFLIIIYLATLIGFKAPDWFPL